MGGTKEERKKGWTDGVSKRGKGRGGGVGATLSENTEELLLLHLCCEE